jgi:hypothetical protein
LCVVCADVPGTSAHDSADSANTSQVPFLI